ncbi:hypothetical protein [Methylophilus medardicus]|uniref:PEP-CTERM sorting domain-containing protein n=1 Tax=Methylophilus medardicus TaxID=2588534 RepID=A0A5B8CP94_9PROT|nr:hypothetical protein [Methylophilus medardicus]QDC43095.1 hypothetical protein FIU01_00205 [Methylophilus medardicus]QDC48102.1 hypothetical protein FIU00_00205 [Methylophilus medardicus]QDC51807.1 hypothetical protein FIT99_00205 [Methylophilus medardicus]
MLRRAVVLSLLACLPMVSHATASLHLSHSVCSGPLSLSTSRGIALSCAGNMTLEGGWMADESQISLVASGDLILDHFILRAPEIQLSSLTGLLNLGSNVTIDTRDSQASTQTAIIVDRWLTHGIHSWQPFDIMRAPGGVLSIQSPALPAAGNAQIRILPEGLGGSLQIVGQPSLRPANAGIVRTNQVAVGLSAVPEPDRAMLLLTGLGLFAYGRKHHLAKSGQWR